jgi:hypothetical protein
MYLLQTSVITVDYNRLALPHLIAFVAIIFAALLVLVIIFTYGVTVEWGNKKFSIGGIKRLLARKDADARIKEGLKKFTDDVDREAEADLYDLIEDMDSRMEHVLLKEHCYFTLDRFVAIAKRELYKRVRRNNLKERLAEENIDRYTDKVLRNIETRYDVFQLKLSGVKCGESYEKFPVIKEAVRKELLLWANGARAVLINSMKKKIEKYEAANPEFKTAEMRKFCCADCIVKNKAYIKNLIGEGV